MKKNQRAYSIVLLAVFFIAACGELPTGAKPAATELPGPLHNKLKKKAVQACWNTWFENQANDQRAVVLTKGELYTFVLDLSRFAYFKDYAATVGPSVQEAIKVALQRGDKRIRFTIRPILHGDFFRFADNQPASLPLDAELTKLKEPAGAAQEAMQRKLDKFLAGKSQLRDFAKDVQAGEVRFALVAEREGDATISISIWDKTGKIPLDHLTLAVQIINPADRSTKAELPGQTIPLKAGLGTLLDVSMDFASHGSLVADAAFYIFEPGPKGKSIVLFAAGKPKNISPPNQAQKVEVYAWETDSLLSRYIDDSSPLGILEKIKNARALAEENQKYSYRGVAAELSKKIFTGSSDADQKQAAEAETIFRELVRRQKQAAIVFVRMRNADGRPVYLPLGILAAHSQNPILEKRIVVVQPLPRERYPAGAHPVEAWIFSIPEQLPELEPLCQDALHRLNISASQKFYRDISGFRDFLKTSPPESPDSKPEGILLLAHQGGGNLWFTDMAQRIIREDIKHTFPPGSVAILSACSAAAAGGNNQAILEKLNNNGIDSMIISPFPVDANYGAMFAIYLFETLNEARANSKRLTMADLFNTAAKKTSAYFGKRDLNFEEMSLEFLIAGDYRILLAPQ